MASLLESATPPPERAEPPASPFCTRQTAAVVNGVHTDVIVQTYRDRLFVTITQMEKVGTLLFATSEESSSGGRLFDVSVLFGRRDDPLLVLYARQLVEQLFKVRHSELPLLVSVALKEDGRDSATFQALVNLVLNLVPA